MRSVTRISRRTAALIMLAVIWLPLAANVHAEAPSGLTISHPPRIAIVIDDIGSQLGLGMRAISVPRSGPITFAVIPFTPYAKRLAQVAHELDNEVILHLPMEPLGNYNPHQGMVKHDMQRQAVIRTVRAALDEIPHITGFNNHMGSLVTQTPHIMDWVMEEVSLNTSLFFLDSRTSPRSVAFETAKGKGIPTLKRDIFLDSKQDIDFVEKQFGKLMTVAMQQGYAIGIGHPYPETLNVLEKYLPRMQRLGFELVSLSDILSTPSVIPYRYAAKTTLGNPHASGEEESSLIFNHQPSIPDPLTQAHH